MRVLALEPYYGGSHKAFADGWMRYSRHQFTPLTLPPSKWKWRMRHAAVSFAEEVTRKSVDSESWDVLFCSDMLNLAEFRGLIPESLQRPPAVAYFHENQLTYPVRVEKERDYHFGFTNLTTCLAADAVWFNSHYHRSAFLEALRHFLARMPDHQQLASMDEILQKTAVYYPGIEDFPARQARAEGPIRIVWAARWEYDKNPEAFFAALRLLKDRGVDFRISVIGEQYEETPPVFADARREFAEHIDHWGYQQSREEYVRALLDGDVIVSTADHEFYGLSVVEGIAAGAYPLLPNRLSYPEILQVDRYPRNGRFLYDGTPEGLARGLSGLAEGLVAGSIREDSAATLRVLVERLNWRRQAAAMDDGIESICTSE